ncbi:MAG: hypothetical protein CVV02_00060 [Firmicutes bacterium HGW-Firmicutes-7]|nr:MAG: hypothetical protein CVV02_00060 [Firmicutes bacterium HGW-Firmicutes-7]
MGDTIKNHKKKNQVKNIVSIKNLSSREYFLYDNKERRQVLKNINLFMNKEETWGIMGESAFEIKLLLEIMANIRAYDTGRCILVERGMLRHKRIILKHVFYIGNSDMIYENMNVLEFLVFAIIKFKADKVELQEQIFEFLIDMGLGHISLTSNKMLTKEEKAVITLIAAAHSDSVMIVFNFPDYRFDEVLVDAIEKIADFMRKRGKCLIIGTQNGHLIDKTCSHISVLADGNIIYQGTVENFCLSFDKVMVIIRDANIYSIMDKLIEIFPEYKISIKSDSLLINRLNEEIYDPLSIYKKIIEMGIVPDYMEINPKTVSNAYEEIIVEHDLQK